MAIENQGRRVLGCPTSKDTGNLLGTVILEIRHIAVTASLSSLPFP